MGSALATAFLRASTRLTIWNRTDSRPSINTAIESGATFQPEIKTAIQSSDIILFCVVDYGAIYDLLGSSPTLSGKTIINLTNGTPKQAEEMDTFMKGHRASTYIDGAVMVTPEMVHTPYSLLVYSGEGFESISQVVAPLGRSINFGEKVESAATVDLAALAAMYGMFLGSFIGMNLLKKAGLPALPATEQVTAPIAAALTSALVRTARKIDEEDWLGGSANPLAMQQAGVCNMLEACRDAGVDGSMFEVVDKMIGWALREHGSDASFAAATLYLLK